MKIVIVDIETTGFLREGGLIVEVGIVELDLETGERKIIYDELVKEDDFGEMHKGAWIFDNSDLTFEEVYQANPLEKEKIQQILDTYEATAYNKNFDFDFLESRGIFAKTLPCPMKIMTNICKLPGRYGNYKWPSVQEAYDFFFEEEKFLEKHRGADDALHEAKVVYELFRRGKFVV